MPSTKMLIKCLIDSGLMQEAPDEGLRQEQGQRVIDYLSKQELVDEDQALACLSKELAIDAFDLESNELQSKIANSSLVSKLDEKFCKEACLIPLYEEEGEILVAQANPYDFESLKSISFTLSKPTRGVVAKASQIDVLINKLFRASKSIGLSTLPDTDVDMEISHASLIDQSVDVDDADAAPIVKLVNRILVDAVGLEASDIHIEPTKDNLNVRFRIDGVMQKIIELPKGLHRFLIARIKLLSGMNIAERRKPQDGRLKISYAGKSVDMRASCIPTASGEKIVLRLLRDDYEGLQFAAIGFTPELETKLKTALGQDNKLVLVTGPTGSGKTTTLYTSLNYLRDGTRNITTVEDPIEYRFNEINQIQVNTSAGVTFPSALRSILRQDPDVIMIGEIRDQETANIAVQSAQTGHLVLSTLHTNSALETITRLLDLGVERYAIAGTLAGVLAQRLVRKICEDCKTKVEKSSIAEHENYLTTYNVDWQNLKHGIGCSVCNNTGFKGRIGIYSYLEIDDAVSLKIQSGSPMREIIDYAKTRGYCELGEAAIKLAENGLTTIHEALPYLISDNTQSLPEAEAPIDEPSPHADAKKEQISSASGKGRILIIDDSKIARKFIVLALQDEFVELLEAENGLQALEIMQEHVPDLILCDIQMPIMDGKEFLKKVRQRKATRDIPVLMLTAESDPGTEADLLEMGANDFVQKNADQRVILSRIKRFVALI